MPSPEPEPACQTAQCQTSNSIYHCAARSAATSPCACACSASTAQVDVPSKCMRKLAAALDGGAESCSPIRFTTTQAAKSVCPRSRPSQAREHACSAAAGCNKAAGAQRYRLGRRASPSCTQLPHIMVSCRSSAYSPSLSARSRFHGNPRRTRSCARRRGRASSMG